MQHDSVEVAQSRVGLAGRPKEVDFPSHIHARSAYQRARTRQPVQFLAYFREAAEVLQIEP
jgi:hypothetical protein